MKYNIIFLILIINIISLNSFGENIPKKVTPCNIATNSANVGFVKNSKSAGEYLEPRKLILPGGKIDPILPFNAIGIPDEKIGDLAKLIEKSGDRGIPLSDLNRMGFNEDAINEINLKDFASAVDDKTYSRILNDVTDRTIFLGKANNKRTEFWFKQAIKTGDKNLLRYANEDSDELIKIYKKLIDKIDGSRSVVINDPIAYADHTKQIDKLKSEIKYLESLQKKY